MTLPADIETYATLEVPGPNSSLLAGHVYGVTIIGGVHTAYHKPPDRRYVFGLITRRGTWQLVGQEEAEQIKSLFVFPPVIDNFDKAKS